MTRLARFPRSRLSSESFVKFSFHCVHMRGRVGSVPEISVFPTGISVSGLKILPYELFSPVTGILAGWILAARMASSFIAYCVFHIISIPFNCIDTALRVAQAMVGAKVRIFVFCHICFVSRISRQNSSRGFLAFFHHGNRAEISHMNPKRNWSR